MIPIIVPDINVLLSGATISKYAPSKIIQAWIKNQIEVATSEAILIDLRRASFYPRVRKFTHMTSSEINDFINFVRNGAIIVPGKISVDVSKDKDDNKLFSCAIEASADYIVSMDKKDVLPIKEFRGVKTIHPTDFVNYHLK